LRHKPHVSPVTAARSFADVLVVIDRQAHQLLVA
jgi:hypothetical protein